MLEAVEAKIEADSQVMPPMPGRWWRTARAAVTILQPADEDASPRGSTPAPVGALDSAEPFAANRDATDEWATAPGRALLPSAD